MKNDSVHERLRKTLWRRPLTDAESAELRAWLAVHPEAQADWTADQQLSRALGRLANAPVPSNFTACVLQAVEREQAIAPRTASPAWRGWWRSLGWVPKLATACVVVGLSVLSHQQYQAVSRERMAQSVAALTESGPLPSPEALQNFDIISRMAQTPPADEELLALLQ